MQKTNWQVIDMTTRDPEKELLECKGMNGEYFVHKFHGYDMVNTCEFYFSALRTGYQL